MELVLFLLGLTQIVFCSFNLIISFLSHQKSKNKIFIILISSFLIILLNASSIVLISIFDTFNAQLSFIPFISYQIFGITGAFTFFMTYLFLALLNHDSPPLIQLIYFSTLLSGFLFLAFIPSNYIFYYDRNLGIYNFEYNIVIQILILILTISVFVYYVCVLLQIRKLSHHKYQKRALKLFFLGLCITMAGLILPTIFNHREWIILFNSISLFFLGLSFYQHPNIVFLNPNQLFYLIITNKNGITLYSHEFQKNFTDIDENLIGGALNALSVVFMEVFKTSHTLKQIKMKDRVILFQTSNQISVALIVSKSTFLLQQTLYSFSNAFIAKYKEILHNWEGNLDVFEDIDNMIRYYFPFVEI